ncbi:hypothetical protein LTR78_005233 [Recurvomyces mirabilis]|uniref:Uncharacterized protein n=1 Tax=Recurvomyces mirabilis TaxID=574656 RepID=A0AAE0WN57_9PEZI|nr:hypothetical protein LTR78_005233 [Recurvomyces mirabilis]KAK5157783.1 hypothetical protein LTS14_003705 [Recurvomyces mirabilis]
MSTERSSSAVRNLRSLFENKAPEQSPDTRGRSPSHHLTESSPSRPASKVRASFVSVVPPTAAMASSAEEAGVGSGMAELKRESSAGLRRGSFSENDGELEGLLQLKKTVSEEAERRQRDPKVAESIPEHVAFSAATTPNVKASMNGEEEQHIEESPLADKVDKEPAHPDKPVTAAEEEPGTMKPADMSSEAVVSGGKALPPVAEDMRKGNEPKVQKSDEAPTTKALDSAVEETKKPATSKPTPVSIKAPAKAASSSVKSPAKATTPPKPAETSTKPTQLAKKASRSSLTAPTAASVARAAGQDKPSSKPAQPPMPKRDATKPIDLPSRLTAPTAASRARHEPASTTTSAPSNKQSTTSRPKPSTSSTRPTPRTSFARPESRSSHTSKKPPTSAPTEGSFLERMMRPTAASANKTHEKPEVKSPPRGGSKTAAVKAKVNGIGGKKHDSASEPGKESTHGEADGHSAMNGNGNCDAVGNETPIPASGERNGALRATPAFGEDTIR